MWLLLAILLIAILLPMQNSFAANDALRIVFIDVGQGDSALVILPNNKTMLIDGGERDQYQVVLSSLRDHNITNIDVVVATHPHADHIGGLIGVIENVNVSEVMDSGQTSTT